MPSAARKAWKQEDIPVWAGTRQAHRHLQAECKGFCICHCFSRLLIVCNSAKDLLRLTAMDVGSLFHYGNTMSLLLCHMWAGREMGGES
jgi:hypothetical protein